MLDLPYQFVCYYLTCHLCLFKVAVTFSYVSQMCWILGLRTSSATPRFLRRNVLAEAEPRYGSLKTGFDVSMHCQISIYVKYSTDKLGAWIFSINTGISNDDSLYLQMIH